MIDIIVTRDRTTYNIEYDIDSMHVINIDSEIGNDMLGESMVAYDNDVEVSISNEVRNHILNIIDMDNFDNIYMTLPSYINKDRYDTVIAGIIRSMYDKTLAMKDISSGIYDMISINSTRYDDLYDRWGSLLGIRRLNNESSDSYRSRVMAITRGAGGTHKTIQIALAAILGITDESIMIQDIRIYDAWEYTGTASVIKLPGYIVCEVDLKNSPIRDNPNITSILNNTIDNTKACGIISQLLILNSRMVKWEDAEQYTWNTASTLKWNQVGIGG